MVDGKNAAWTDRDCEKTSDSIGLKCVARTDASGRIDLEMLFDAAKPPTTPTCDLGNATLTQYDAYRGVGGRAGAWRVCAEPAQSLAPAQQAFLDAMTTLAGGGTK